MEVVLSLENHNQRTVERGGTYLVLLHLDVALRVTTVGALLFLVESTSPPSSSTTMISPVHASNFLGGGIACMGGGRVGGRSLFGTLASGLPFVPSIPHSWL